jgi:type IV pilus assembly protein PilV
MQNMKQANTRQVTAMIASRQRGVGMIEVLIAILVMAVGILGMASVQLVSKRTSFEAVQRVTAVFLAEDILQRIRTNSSVLASYNGVTVHAGAVPATQACTSGAPCNAEANMAAYDVEQWYNAVAGVAETQSGTNAGGLVNPVGCITVNGNLVTVAIAWRGFQPMTNYGASEEYRQLFTTTVYVADG